jgi:hypothetical protein
VRHSQSGHPVEHGALNGGLDLLLVKNPGPKLPSERRLKSEYSILGKTCRVQPLNLRQPYRSCASIARKVASRHGGGSAPSPNLAFRHGTMVATAPQAITAS